MKTVIEMAREAGFVEYELEDYTQSGYDIRYERFAELVRADAIADEREACAQVCEEKQEYSMPIPCPDGISGCLVAHYIPARREKTGSECATAIRARSNT